MTIIPTVKRSLMAASIAFLISAVLATAADAQDSIASQRAADSAWAAAVAPVVAKLSLGSRLQAVQPAQGDSRNIALAVAVAGMLRVPHRPGPSELPLPPCDAGYVLTLSWLGGPDPDHATLHVGSSCLVGGSPFSQGTMYRMQRDAGGGWRAESFAAWIT